VLQFEQVIFIKLSAVSLTKNPSGALAVLPRCPEFKRATPVLPHVGQLSGTWDLVVTMPDYGRSKRNGNRAVRSGVERGGVVLLPGRKPRGNVDDNYPDGAA
jgi:hypothetical protein